MPSLPELQAGFRDALFAGGPAEEALLSWLEEAGSVGRQRLAAYRRSILGRLVDALEATYPVLTALVGRPFLREAARRYALAQPSVSGDLNDYGGDFADFLAAYPHASGLPYLPDVARLEWRVQDVAYGPEAPPPALDELARTAPEDWPELVFTLAPAHARLDSRWPLAAIWRQNQPGQAEDDEEEVAVDLSQACHALVWRQGVRIRVEELAAGEAALFDALAAGERLGAALARAAAAEPASAPGPSLQRFAAAGLLLSAELSRGI